MNTQHPQNTQHTSPRDTAGVYVVSIVRRTEPGTLLADLHTHLGGTPGNIALPEQFTFAGFDAGDLTGFCNGLNTLAAGPTDETTTALFGERGGVNSEGERTDVHMLGLGGTKTDTVNWLACAEAVHAAWPTLLRTVGVSVGGTLIGPGDAQHSVHVPGMRVPKALRLKSGWDYDDDGNQVWMPFDEAWTKFIAHTETEDGTKMSGRIRRRMRRHMKSFYRERAADPTHPGHAAATQ